MEDLLAKNGAGAVVYRIGENVKGTIIASSKEMILLDLDGGLTGIIPKKEIMGTGEFEDEFSVGTLVEAAIVDDMNDQGLVVMSLRRASQDVVWAELNTFEEESRIIKVKISEANKGGLMAKYKGVKSFLPVSQLTPMNYPRVDGADSGAILTKLQKHIGKDFAVRVINVDRETGKVIISEKAAHEEQAKKTLESLQIGDVVSGEVSGVVKFGIFITFGGIEGLVHLSELDWGLVSNPAQQYKVGDKVDVQVIGIDGDKLSLSIKRLTEDPWIAKGNSYSTGQEVAGNVVRWNQQGVFVEIEKDVIGVFELSDFDVQESNELTLKVGETIKGEVKDVNFDSHRVELKKL